MPLSSKHFQLIRVRTDGQRPGDTQDALRTLSDPLFALCGLWYTFSIQGRYEEALAAAGGCLRHYGPEVKEALTPRRTEAEYREAMGRGADRLATGVRGVYVAPIDVFLAYLHARQTDRALAWFSKAVDARDPNVIGAVVDPQTASLRGDSRFPALVQRTGLPL